MALRAVLNRSKAWGPGRGTWGYQLVKGKFGSVGDKSIVAHVTPLLPVSSSLSSRHYYLPPPPPVQICGSTFDLDPGSVSTVADLGLVLPSVHFALRMYNEAEGRNIRFERVVRASQTSHYGSEYYITLEGINENGRLNVYYAEVLDVVYKQTKQLIKFQQVDESFSYPFLETRWCERIIEREQQDREGKTNDALIDWLRGVARQNEDDKTSEESFAGSCIGNSNVLGKIMNFEKNAIRITGVSPPSSNDDMHPLHTVTDDGVIQFYNMVDYNIVVKHAWSAVEIYNNKEGEEICLEEVLYSRKVELNGEVFYILLLETLNKKKDLSFYYTVIKVAFPFEVELIKWHVVDELFSGPLKKDQASPMYFPSPNLLSWRETTAE